MRLAPPFLAYYNCHPALERAQVEVDILAFELGVVVLPTSEVKALFNAALGEGFGKLRYDAWVAAYNVSVFEVDIDGMQTEGYFPGYPAVVDSSAFRGLFGRTFESCQCYVLSPTVYSS